MMKALFIEDHVLAAKLSKFLEKHGFVIHRARDLLEADYLLETLGPFDAAIVDLDLDKRFLPDSLQQEAETQHAGWLYYVHTLRNIPPLDKNTIIVSALVSDFKKTISREAFTDLIMIDKTDDDYHLQVKAALEHMKCAPSDDLESGCET